MRTAERKVMFALGAALVAAPVAGVLLVMGLYQYGLTLLPEKPHLDVAAAVPPILQQAVWARFGGLGPPVFEPMTVWGFVSLRVCRFNGGSAGREACLSAHPGVAIADSLARQHTRSHDVSPDGLGQVATAGWLTRNGSAEGVISGLVSTAEWGRGWHGVDEAARGYFGKAAFELAASEAAVLAASLTDAANRSRGVDPWCAPTESTAARNGVLRRMAANGAIASSALQALAQTPLGVIERACP
jgi:hypothetical protein